VNTAGEARRRECHRLMSMGLALLDFNGLAGRKAYSCSTIKSSSFSFCSNGRSAYAWRVSAKCVQDPPLLGDPWDKRIEYLERCWWYDESWEHLNIKTYSFHLVLQDLRCATVHFLNCDAIFCCPSGLWFHPIVYYVVSAMSWRRFATRQQRELTFPHRIIVARLRDHFLDQRRTDWSPTCLPIVARMQYAEHYPNQFSWISRLHIYLVIAKVDQQLFWEWVDSNQRRSLLHRNLRIHEWLLIFRLVLYLAALLREGVRQARLVGTCFRMCEWMSSVVRMPLWR